MLILLMNRLLVLNHYIYLNVAKIKCNLKINAKSLTVYVHIEYLEKRFRVSIGIYFQGSDTCVLA